MYTVYHDKTNINDSVVEKHLSKSEIDLTKSSSDGMDPTVLRNSTSNWPNLH